MRVVALEEHATLPDFDHELETSGFAKHQTRTAERFRADLEDIHDRRIASMDEFGITVQVLSVPGFGAVLFPPDAAPSYAQRYNDAMAAAAKRHPDRFAAFAHLPSNAPQAAADELERTVRTHNAPGALISGTIGGKFLDDPSFAPLLARAERLDVPIYVHPGPPPDVVTRAYYAGFAPQVEHIFAAAGWGWHAETAVHVLRMVLRGTFEQHPKLKVIIGHMGEGLPAMLARCDDMLSQRVTGLPRSVSETILEHVWITTSGFFTLPPFLAALLTFGADRMLFSVDYPFSSNAAARAFLDALPVSPDDREKIAHANADRLLKLT